MNRRYFAEGFSNHLHFHMSTEKKSTKRGRKEPPVILITNDDSVTAPGIRHLAEAVKDLGKVVIVAPDKPQSGMGHAITIGSPLRLQPVKRMEGVEAWSCSGTPVDCVKMAVDNVLHRKPDICLSGINHGANHSINVIYSGTMSAAITRNCWNCSGVMPPCSQRVWIAPGAIALMRISGPSTSDSDCVIMFSADLLAA